MDYEKIENEILEKGYVIIENILQEEEINDYIQEFNIWKNKIKYLDDFHRYVEFKGIFKFHEVGHQRFAWVARTNKKIINTFKNLWNTNELVTSFDGCCYYPKNHIDDKAYYWTHTDQSGMKKGRHCLQSFVSLTNNKERTLIVYEGSHKLHESYFEERNIQNPKDWCIIDKDYIETIKEKKRILNIKKGSLVIWDSRTFHQNTSGDSDCNEERLVQYLCYLPKDHELNDQEMQDKRFACFKQRLMTSHWPYPISVVPQQPFIHSDDNNRINYNELQEPDLDDLIDEIEKLL